MSLLHHTDCHYANNDECADNTFSRGEYADGSADTNRVVTITGPPANAQTAHMLINQRLQVRLSTTLTHVPVKVMDSGLPFRFLLRLY